MSERATVTALNETRRLWVAQLGDSTPQMGGPTPRRVTLPPGASPCCICRELRDKCLLFAYLDHTSLGNTIARSGCCICPLIGLIGLTTPDAILCPIVLTDVGRRPPASRTFLS
jgi:hypothetical protein